MPQPLNSSMEKITHGNDSLETTISLSQPQKADLQAKSSLKARTARHSKGA